MILCFPRLRNSSLVPRLDYRQVWDVDYRAYLKKLDEVKPIIVCGDLNVAHEEIGRIIS